jgi:hypothetical protein
METLNKKLDKSQTILRRSLELLLKDAVSREGNTIVKQL